MVHASDLSLRPGNADLREIGDDRLAALFDERLEYLATSDGQAEIKRNETFTRVWRNAVGLAQRSLKSWVEADAEKPIHSVNEKTGFVDHDLSQTPVSQAAITQYEEEPKSRAHFVNHARVLFGADPIGPEGESRASILVSDDDQTNREMMWAFLRISAELRNRSNHFCTKERLVDLVTGRSDRKESGSEADAIVEPVESKNTGQHGAHRVDLKAIRKLDDLLAFDKHVERRMLVDELNAIDFHRHCSIRMTLDRSALLREMSRSTAGSKIATPRFMAVAHVGVDLAKDDDASDQRTRSPLAELKLDNDAITQPGANRFSVEVLRKLYQQGFRAWLHDRCPGLDELTEDEPQSMRAVIEAVVDEKKVRKERANREDGVSHAHIESILSTLGLDDLSNPFDFLRKLTAESMIEERLNQTYSANRNKQKEVANRVERFRQELTLKFFECYLRVMDFEAVTEDFELDEDAPEGQVSLSDIDAASDWQTMHWHGRFYAWLYLVPPEDISALRQQLMKSRALEIKSAGDTDGELESTLDDLDRLMALYCSVNTAGFDGTEHHEGIEHGKEFYEDAGLFGTILDADETEPEISLRGTRRGLRQILRFGNMKVLSKIIERHKVTSREVEALLGNRSEQNRQERESQRELHAEIVKACKAQFRQPDRDKQDWTGVHRMCADYSEFVTRTTLHDFSVNAARLTEFARLHSVMMRMIGRLADYTLIWERDMICLFLGLYYREQKELGSPLRLTRNVLKPDEGGMQPAYRGNHAIFQLRPGNADGDAVLDLWGDRSGFLGLHFNKIDEVKEFLSDKRSQERFWWYFDGKEVENEKDQKGNPRRLSSNHLRKGDGFKKIRNDFAHYNMFTRKKERLNMTYQVNAVRSLFGYDRKLKNAVSKSIKRIAEQAGVDLGFELSEDRLTKVSALPVLTPHLTMVPTDERVNDGRCSIPRTSVRFTSMVRALFDHDKGGNRKRITVDGKAKRVGVLSYAPQLESPEDAPIPTMLHAETL